MSLNQQDFLLSHPNVDIVGTNFTYSGLFRTTSSFLDSSCNISSIFIWPCHVSSIRCLRSSLFVWDYIVNLLKKWRTFIIGIRALKLTQYLLIYPTHCIRFVSIVIHFATFYSIPLLFDPSFAFTAYIFCYSTSFNSSFLSWSFIKFLSNL